MQEELEKNPLSFVCPFTYMQARTCFIDDAVETFVGDHPDGNVVFLGAGMDSRCYRMTLPEGLALYEVDAAGSAAAKQAVLDTLPTPAPCRARVRYVTCNFRQQHWEDALRAAGFDFARPTCVVWEGVSYYLPEAEVERTLRVVASGALSTAPAVIVFDYFSPEQKAVHGEGVAKSGEPWLFTPTGDEMATLAEAAGLAILDNLSAADLQPTCMPLLPDGSPAGHASRAKMFMAAGNRQFMGAG